MATPMVVAPTTSVSNGGLAPHGRIDLGELKKKLIMTLNKDATDYWLLLRKFVQAKLTKLELDTFAREALNDNLYLHNQFIASILNNAYSPQLPALPQRTAPSAQAPPPAPSSTSPSSTASSSSSSKKSKKKKRTKEGKESKGSKESKDSGALLGTGLGSKDGIGAKDGAGKDPSSGSASPTPSSHKGDAASAIAAAQNSAASGTPAGAAAAAAAAASPGAATSSSGSAASGANSASGLASGAAKDAGKDSKDASKDPKKSKRSETRRSSDQTASPSLPSASFSKRTRQLSTSGVIRLQRSPKSSARSGLLKSSHLDLQLAGSPRLLALRQKMLKCVLEAGLADVSNEAVEYMMLALEYHLKEIMSCCNPTIRLHELRRKAAQRTSASAMVLEPTPPPSSVQIGPRDLLCGAETAPHLLGENLPITQERLILMQQ